MRLLPRPEDWPDLVAPSHRLGLLALAAATGSAAIAILSLSPVLALLLEPPGDPPDQTAAADRFTADLDLATARVTGRSLFFVPAPPPPPPPPPVVIAPSTPAPPSRYAGPSLIAIVGDQAWFASGGSTDVRRLTIGDESDETLAVLEVRAPWSARVRWQGVEFDIPLFERAADLTQARSPSPSDPPPAPDAPADAPPPDTAPQAPEPAPQSAQEPAPQPEPTPETEPAPTPSAGPNPTAHPS